MTAPYGCPDEASRQERGRALRGCRRFVAAVARGSGCVLRRIAALRAWIPVLLVGHEPERLCLRSLRTGRIGFGAALFMDDVLADAFCPENSRASIGHGLLGLAVQAIAPRRIPAGRDSADQVSGAAGG